MNREELGDELLIRVERGSNGYAVRFYKPGAISCHEHIVTIIAESPKDLGIFVGQEVFKRFPLEQSA